MTGVYESMLSIVQFGVFLIHSGSSSLCWSLTNEMMELYLVYPSKIVTSFHFILQDTIRMMITQGNMQLKELEKNLALAKS